MKETSLKTLVPENEATQAQTAHSQRIDGLLTLVGVAQRFRVPSQLEPLEVRTILGNAIDQLIDQHFLMDLGATALGHAGHEDPEIAQRGQNARPELVGDVRDAGQDEAAQLRSKTYEELVQGVLAKRFASVEVEGHETACVSLFGESAKYLQLRSLVLRAS